VAVRLIALAIALWGCGRLSFQTGDAASGDARGEGPLTDAPLPCPAFATFCDGFETGDITKWTDMNITTGATTIPTTAIVHSGTYALDATVPPGSNGDLAVVEHRILTFTNGMLTLREWIYQPQPLIHFDNVLRFDQVAGPSYVTVGSDTIGAWDASEDSPSGGPLDHSSTPIVPVNRWTCVELDLTSGSPNTIEVFVDDVSVISDSMLDTVLGYDDIAVGVPRAYNAGSRTIVDDVVIANQHIGCQ
jgi:hypothetical protein